MALARAQYTVSDQNDPIMQGFAPANPVVDMLWLNTSVTPNDLRRWTGSEWASVGKPSAVGIENVTITPTAGLRVDTVLSNAGASVPVYFSARGTQIGLYRTSDNKQLWGGRLLPDGRVVTVTSALIDPDGDGRSWVEFVQSADGPEIRLVNPSWDGITPRIAGDNPAPVRTYPSMVLKAWNRPQWNTTRGAYEDYTWGTIRCGGFLSIETYGGLALSGGTGTSIDGNHSQYGNVAFSVGASTAGVIHVTFPFPYLMAPMVFLTLVASATWGAANYFVVYYVVEGSVTATGFDIRVINNYGSTRTGSINWMAVGYPA